MPEYIHQDYVIMAIIATARPDVRLAAMALCEILQQLDQAGGSLHQTAHPAVWNELMKHHPGQPSRQPPAPVRDESYRRRRDRWRADADEREQEQIMSQTFAELFADARRQSGLN